MELTVILLTIFIGLSLIIYNFLRRRQYYWRDRNVPYIEGEFFYGNSRGVGKTIFSGIFFKDMYFKLKNKGPIAGLNVYTEPMAMATNLDLIKTILIKDFNTFPNRGIYHNEEDDPASANLVAIEDDKWRTLRNKFTPTFSSGKIKMMFPILVEVADKMIQRIAIESEQFGALDVKDMNARFTVDVIGKAAFGIECNSLDDKSTKFFEMGLKAFEKINFFKRQLTANYPNLSRKLHITSSNHEVVNFYKDVVEQTIKYREENKIQSNDFMQMLIKMMKQPNESLTFNEVWAQCIVFFLAGYETTATTLSYCFYELSQNKDIQKKLREEIKTVLNKHNGEFSYDALAKMQYVEQCINEALRKHPPAVGTRRTAREEYKVPNTKIVLEKGSQVIIPIFGIHFDPEIYPNPEKYDPNRFSPEEVAKRHNFAFLPFGEGPRNCIGARFAIVEAKLALAKIIMNYELDLDRTKTPVPLTYQVNRLLLTPTTGIFINFKRI